jgi:transposase
MADRANPIEVRSLGATLSCWKEQIICLGRGHGHQRPTEAANNLIKRIKRVAFGFRSFGHHRVRVLLYAGNPNLMLLPTVSPAEI